jgi:hypothetical protein
MTTQPVPDAPYPALLAHVALQQQALLRTPHSAGDHTDLCRFHNAGLAPELPQACRCHVAAVQQSLTNAPPYAERLAQVVRVSRHLVTHVQSANGHRDERLAVLATELHQALQRLEEFFA